MDNTGVSSPTRNFTYTELYWAWQQSFFYTSSGTFVINRT